MARIRPPGAPGITWILTAALVLLTLCAATPSSAQPEHIVLSWNDLGMHCMNQWHATLSVLPPYNNLYAQVIRLGTATTTPQVVTTGLTLEYSIPGNTYSAGKTDFWDYVLELFGVSLPPDVGLTGKTLADEFDPMPTFFKAEGIPVTPFPDATPTVEDPYQQAYVLARDALGTAIGESHPVIPVSVEIACVSAGCHASETAILNGHELVPGFDPTQTPILCASCHASPALGTPGIPEAEYFSLQIHKHHEFIDQMIPGIDGCYKCHPGQNTQCLRGTMATDFGLVCQNCHGTMNTMFTSIEQGRTPWMNEPACRTCHTATYGEPPGQLFRNSTGHGGVFCAACHGSPHADFPSREPRDNANNVALQGHAGILSDCTVCHGTIPAGPGPHGAAVSVIEAGVLDARRRLVVNPSPMRERCTIEVEAGPDSNGRLLVFDTRGRTVRLLETLAGDTGRRHAEWDGRTRRGDRVPAGAYYIRWENGAASAAAKIVLLD